MRLTRLFQEVCRFKACFIGHYCAGNIISAAENTNFIETNDRKYIPGILVGV